MFVKKSLTAHARFAPDSGGRFAARVYFSFLNMYTNSHIYQ